MSVVSVNFTYAAISFCCAYFQ